MISQGLLSLERKRAGAFPKTFKHPAARSDVALLWAALILAAQPPAPAQEVRVSSRPYAPSPFVLRVDTNLVETGVVVRDRNGHAIAGLTQGDFKIFDDGKSSLHSNLPRSRW